MFELTIGEYDEVQSLGTFETRKAALQALGQWVMDNPTAQFVRPHITQL